MDFSKIEMILLVGVVLLCTMGAIAAADVTSDSNDVDLGDCLSGYNPLHPSDDDGRVILSNPRIIVGDKPDYNGKMLLSSDSETIDPLI